MATGLKIVIVRKIIINCDGRFIGGEGIQVRYRITLCTSIVRDKFDVSLVLSHCAAIDRCWYKLDVSLVLSHCIAIDRRWNK